MDIIPKSAEFLYLASNLLKKYFGCALDVAKIQIFEKKTYLILIKNETGLKFKINVSTLFLIGSYAQILVATY